MKMNLEKLRNDFEILGKRIKNRSIIYFDNACMTLKPRQVIDAINGYYRDYPACGERSQHYLGQRVTEEVEKSRRTLAKFIGARSEREIIFTRNATESINIVANGFGFGKKRNVLLSEKEHNSNLLPWLRMKKRGVLDVQFAQFGQDGFGMDDFSRKVKDAGLVSIVWTSNMDGSSVPVEEVIKASHERGVPVLLDAAQAVPHRAVNVKKLDADFLAFSGHKMLGPTGTGALYGKMEMLEKLDQLIVGGGTVKDSSYGSMEWEDVPERFEAGLQDYAGIIGMGAAAEYLMKAGMDGIGSQEKKLNRKASEGLKGIGARILGPGNPDERAGIVSFNLPGFDSHTIAIMLSQSRNIMVRSGRHCVHSWFNSRKIDGSARASFYLYNTEDEVAEFLSEMEKIAGMAGIGKRP
jgi:cysteine desulfurase/selenocysteine lyase